MLDYIAISNKNSWKRFYNRLFIIMAFVLFTVPVEAADQGDNDVSTTEINTISQITAKTSGNNLELVIQGNVEPVYTVYELPNQSKIVVDIANGGVRNPADLVLPRELNIRVQHGMKSMHPKWEWTWGNLIHWMTYLVAGGA